MISSYPVEIESVSTSSTQLQAWPAMLSCEVYCEEQYEAGTGIKIRRGKLKQLHSHNDQIKGLGNVLRNFVSRNFYTKAPELLFLRA